MNPPPPAERRPGWDFLLVFIILAAGIVAAGFLYYRDYERNFRSEAGQQLSTIAGLKVEELVQYRKERLADAGVFFRNSAFSEQVRRFLEPPADADARRRLQAWLGGFQTHNEYTRISLFDVQGAERLAVPGQPEPLSGYRTQDIAAVLKSRQVTFLDFHRDAPSLPIQLGIMVPIFDESDTNRPLGVLALRIDPNLYLYPLLKQWPVPSETAETLLVRREGNEVVFLNELRFLTNSALTQRRPIADTNLPAVKAVLAQTGIVEGRDYRGERVIADVRAVPDSPWFLVAREDVAEVFAPLRTEWWEVAGMAGVLIFGVGAAVGLFWRQQRVRFLRDKLEAQADRARLGAIVESSEDAIIGKNLAGVITSWNAGAERIYGYRAAETIGKSISLLIPPGQPDELPQLMEKIRRGEAVEHYETGRVRKHGERIQVSLTLSPVKDAAGAVVGASAIGRDITERKRAEAILQARLRLLLFAADHSLEELLRQTLDEVGTLTDSPIGFYHFVEADQKTISLQAWSTRTLREFCQAEGKGRHYDMDEAGVWLDCVRQRRTLIHNDYAALPNRKGLPPGHATVVRELVVPIFRRDRIVAVLGVGNKPQDYTEKDVEVVTFMADVAWEIAERKRAEEALRESEERFRRVFKKGSTGMAMLDETFRFIQVNAAFASMLGYSLDKMRTRSFPDLTHPDNVQKDVEQVRRLLRGEISEYRTEKRYLAKSGQEVWGQVQVSVVRTATGAFHYFLAIISNISERKAAETKLQRTLAELERSNKELEQFAYVASHDLQEPLRMVSSYTQLLAKRFEGQLDEKTRKYVHYAVDGAIRMKALINDLLAYSRVGTQGGPLESANANAVLGEALRNLAALIEENQAVITHDNLPTVRADASQLALVFQNLIANAIKFRRDDVPCIHVSARDRGGEWVFAVKDNGIGIELRHADRVFVIFQRLHSHEEYPGTGIGLAVCKRIVERHGGKIWFESNPENGTTFFFTIPQLLANMADKQPIERETGPGGAIL